MWVTTEIPNYLIDNTEKLGIEEKELAFLIKVLRHQDTETTNDSFFLNNMSYKTFCRRRKILKEKGLLTYGEDRLYDTSRHRTQRNFSFDVSPLYEMLHRHLAKDLLTHPDP